LQLRSLIRLPFFGARGVMGTRDQWVGYRWLAPLVSVVSCVPEGGLAIRRFARVGFGRATGIAASDCEAESWVGILAKWLMLATRKVGKSSRLGEAGFFASWLVSNGMNSVLRLANQGEHNGKSGLAARLILEGLSSRGLDPATRADGAARPRSDPAVAPRQADPGRISFSEKCSRICSVIMPRSRSLAGMAAIELFRCRRELAFLDKTIKRLFVKVPPVG
jgi:hypothetical protein